MLTVLIECHEQEAALAQTLSVLVAGAVEGVVREVIVLDHKSNDGTERVAEAAGCRFHQDWNLSDILASARGDWLLLLQPGARLQPGWIEAVVHHVSTRSEPARFRLTRRFPISLWQRLRRKRHRFELGLLVPRNALLPARTQSLEDMQIRSKVTTLSGEILPAWVMPLQP